MFQKGGKVLDQQKIKVYRSIIPLAVVSIFMRRILSPADNFIIQVIDPGFCVFLLGMLYLLWKKPEKEIITELIGFYGIMVYLLVHLTYTIWIDHHVAEHAKPLGDLFYWLPCMYILAFFIFSYRKALFNSFLFYAATVIIPFSHSIYDKMTGAALPFQQFLNNELNPLLQFYLSSAVYVMLLLYVLRMKEAHVEQAAQIEHIFNWIDTAIWSKDIMKNNFMISKGIETIIGVEINESIKKEMEERNFWHAEDQKQLPGIQEKISAGIVSEHQFRLIRPDQEIRWIQESITPICNDAGDVIKHYGVLKDITEQKQKEKEIEYLAYYDPLTGLANRRRFKELASRAIQPGKMSAVLFIDVDRFKLVNDILGHNAGDQLLSMVSERLSLALRKQDVLSRYSGDEFLIFLPDVDRKNTESIVQKLMASLSEPFSLKEQVMFLTASLGISFYPEDGESIDELVKQADTAMYRAKRNGKDRYAFYTHGIDEKNNVKAQLEADLHRAIEKQELELHYQPIVHLNSGQTVGVEALLRWNHSTLGVISPAEFIPIAEETGLIVSLGHWVLREACGQNKKWQNLGYPPLVVSVNMSSRQFIQEDIVEKVHQILLETELAPKWLNIEITESAAMIDLERSIETMKELKGIGIALSMDDFGTGYSSLSYLSQFPLDSLKIDRSFIQNMQVTSRDKKIVDAIIRVAHSLQLKVVAEGVEQEAQLQALQAFLCDQAQGYYFHRPLTVLLCEELVLKQRKQQFFKKG